MSKSSHLFMASLLGMAAMGGMHFPEPKESKVKKTTLDELISEEESLCLEAMEQDRTSPGRKALKEYRKNLSQKYRA